MKRTTMFMSALTALFVMACSTETISEEITSVDPNFKVKDAILDQAGREEAADFSSCLSVNLIAGQHHEAGTVTVENINGDLTLVYTANPGWTIEATHMSIGDCGEQWVPTTGSGNPKIGHFEHSSEHSDGVDQVTYTLDIGVLTEEFCFAAHAEVTGPDGGETAWAEGIGFDGNSWAMFVEALLNGCGSGGDDGEDPIIK